MPDKFYYSAPEGNAPQAVRGKLSELTNLAYSVRQQTNTMQELRGFLNQLRTLPHYEASADRFLSLLEGDLFNACNYWQEMYRYDDCWPIIQAAWQSEEL